MKELFKPEEISGWNAGDFKMNLTKGNVYRIIETGHPRYGLEGRLVFVRKDGLIGVIHDEESTEKKRKEILSLKPHYDVSKVTISVVCKTKYLEEV